LNILNRPERTRRNGVDMGKGENKSRKYRNINNTGDWKGRREEKKEV